MPAPADIDKAPLEPFNKDTLFKALLEAFMVSVNEPAPEALASDMLFPPTSATDMAVPVIEVPPPLKLCVPFWLDAEMVIVLPA